MARKKPKQPNPLEPKKSQEEQKSINETIELFRNNPLLWGKFYCDEHFRDKSPSFHLKILFEALKHKYFAVASPRESAKSTILAFLLPLHCICFQRKKYILLVSNTFKKAAGHLESIKEQLRNNERLKQDYKIKIKKDAEGDSVFEHSDGFTVKFLCRGTDQIGGIRGEKFGAYRPDLIIVDDLEDDEMVKSSTRRSDIKDDYDTALIPAGDKEKCQYVVIGTILHDDSLMAKLVSKKFYPEYRKLLYKARTTNKDGVKQSLWNEKWTVEWLDHLEKTKPLVFAKEYQNDPVAGVVSKFSQKDFRYWLTENNQYILYDPESNIVSKGRLSDCKAAIACDLAWSEKRAADSTAILWGFLTPSNEILIDGYMEKRGMKPDEFAEFLFSLEERLKALTYSIVPIGFEKAMLERVVTWFLKREMRLRGKFLITKDIPWETDKIARCLTVLQPRYAQNVIFHKKNMGDLEHQLLRFPSGVHDDLVDAEQGLCKLLQYPKKRKYEMKHEDEGFEWLRQKAIEKNFPNRNRKKTAFVFGGKQAKSFIKALESYR